MLKFNKVLNLEFDLDLERGSKVKESNKECGTGRNGVQTRQRERERNTRVQSDTGGGKHNIRTTYTQNIDNCHGVMVNIQWEEGRIDGNVHNSSV